MLPSMQQQGCFSAKGSAGSVAAGMRRRLFFHYTEKRSRQLPFLQKNTLIAGDNYPPILSPMPGLALFGLYGCDNLPHLPPIIFMVVLLHCDTNHVMSMGITRGSMLERGCGLIKKEEVSMSMEEKMDD